MTTKAITTCGQCDPAANGCRNFDGKASNPEIPDTCPLQDAEVVEWKYPEKGEVPGDFREVLAEIDNFGKHGFFAIYYYSPKDSVSDGTWFCDHRTGKGCEECEAPTRWRAIT